MPATHTTRRATPLARFASLFADPPADYRPMPQWSWNGDMTKQRIREQLRQFAANGCGGLFTHPRPGHITGYLTDRWFALWDYAAREAKRLGMRFHVYDEFMCPGGTAGGNVAAMDPTVALHELMLVPLAPGAKHPGNVLLRVRIAGGTPVVVPAEAGEATHAVVCAAPDRRIGGLPVPDLLMPGTAAAFIKTTHERYRASSGGMFGKDVTMMFCDEPMILNSGAGLPFSAYLSKEFHREHGYRLEDAKLFSLCFEQPDSPEVRFDFWRTVNRLFNDNFMKPLHDWCGRNNLLFTGHLMEHEWPSPKSTPDNMSGLRWMHAPGEDLLGFQFSPTALADNGLYLMNLKELSSVTSQLGRKWNMVETCGARGYHTSFSYFKPCEDFTLSFGVNVIDTHLAHESLSGSGKYDWPQTLSDHSPWWQYYRPHADHVARVNAALSQGRECNRTLVLMPTTTAWMHYTGSAFDEPGANVSNRRLELIKRAQIDLVVALYQQQIDFDLGDEFILAEFGSAAKGRLVVGERSYDAVVIPPSMETVNATTLALLDAFARSGGAVYAMRVPERVDARVSDAPGSLAMAAGWRPMADSGSLAAALRAQLPPYVTGPGGAPANPGLVWRRAAGKAGTTWFFANPWSGPLDADVRIDGQSALTLDTAAGTISPHGAGRDGGRLALRLTLPPRGHALFLVTDTPAAPVRAQATPALRPVPLAACAAARTKPNMLYIDYCDVEAYGRRLDNVNVTIANKTNWQWQGWSGSPWGKQFRRTVVDAPVDAASEVMVTYRFTVQRLSPSARKSLRACIERPWLYTVELNGRKVAQSTGTRWFDEHMRSFPIGPLAREGANVLRLTARPFRTLCEIMPVYICGDFSLEAAAAGFEMTSATPVTLGDWTRQGMPFYHDRVRYAFEFQLDAPAQSLRARLPGWEGSVAVVNLDNREIGPVMHPPFELAVPGPVRRGRHVLAVDVIGNVKNMMGSHFSQALPLVWSYECAPAAQPAGSAYQFHPTGLMAAPELFACD